MTCSQQSVCGVFSFLQRKKIFKFTGSNRPSVVHVRRSIDIDFPEIVSYPLQQKLMVHGAVAHRTLPAPGVAAEQGGWTLAEEYEDIQDDVVFADGAWNENAVVFEQKDPLDTVLALDADDVVPDDEVVKEAEAAAVEGEAVDFPEVDADRKDEATLRDAVAEEVLVPAKRRTLMRRRYFSASAKVASRRS